MRVQESNGSSELFYLLTDHLGSTALTVDTNGNKVAELRYMPWGETRYTWGTTPTDYTYTGQRSEMDSISLMYYNARWYDPALGRFAQADSIVPGMHPMAFDRYSYVFNNPVRYVDPSGHWGYDANSKPQNPLIDGWLDFEKYSSWYTPNRPLGPSSQLHEAMNRHQDDDTSTTHNWTITDYVDGCSRNDVNYWKSLGLILFPTHGGVRFQLEFDPPTFGNPLLEKFMPGFEVGGELVNHFMSGQAEASLDYAGGFGKDWLPEDVGGGFAFTGGPILGWGASNLDMATADPQVSAGATFAAGPGFATSMSAPLTVDSLYGQFPTTAYLGVGFGVMASVGVDASSTVSFIQTRYP